MVVFPDQFSVHTDGATCGQQVVQLRYRSTAQGEGRSWMGRTQRLLYGLLAVGGAWLEERLDSITASVRHIKYTTQLIAMTQNVWKVAALVNFLIFLMDGKYRFLVERLLHIRPVFEKPQGVRQVGFDYVYQEMLWQGIAEFLFVVLPLINVHRVKNFLRQRLLPRSLETEGRETDYKTCAVCGDWPRSPCQVGCQHVFCHYCVQSNYMADPSFRCPKCGTFIENTDQIQPVLLVSVV
ncbi:hypothetical protein NP493_448g03050 [Ridgeia piscesae]|uniref:Peroxisome biogenesis factor 2 n=1 Tax=Ridgeia piscesae TaxID=27915 RepID=A0AAD9KZ13_RIDPI|nr:hypothetical protein NP493_448g03050 [Ridgeia piscesae]